MSENIGNDCNGAKLREGTRVAYIGRNRLFMGLNGHVTRVHDWNPRGPQTCEWVDDDGNLLVSICDQLRRIKP